jgi:hypothetical protein
MASAGNAAFCRAPFVVAARAGNKSERPVRLDRIGQAKWIVFVSM